MKTRFTLFISLFAISFLSAQIDLESGLIAQYQFKASTHLNNSIPDVTQRGNDLKSINVDYFDNDRVGEFGEAVMLQADNDIYLTLNEQTDLLDFQALEQFTFSFYDLIMPAQYLTGAYPIFSVEDESDKKAIVFFERTESGSDNFTLQYSEGNEILFEIAAAHEFPLFYNWTHITFSFDAVNEQAKFYVDGVLEEAFNLPLSTFHNSKIYFGKSSTAAAGITCFDDMYVHNRVLNAEEVTELYQMTPTAVLDIESNENISIYPIPSINKNINIEVSGYNEAFDVQVYDQLGRIVKQSNITSAEQVDLSALNEGTYYLNLYLTDGVYTKKIVLLK